jgi:hypothetical protein
VTVLDEPRAEGERPQAKKRGVVLSDELIDELRRLLFGGHAVPKDD